MIARLIRFAASPLAIAYGIMLGGEIVRETWVAGRPYLDPFAARMPMSWGGVAFLVTLVVCLLVLGMLSAFDEARIQSLTRERDQARAYSESAQAMIAKALEDRDGARRSLMDWMRIAASRDERILKLTTEVADLTTKLDRFTAPRKRNAKGHFLKGDQ